MSYIRDLERAKKNLLTSIYNLVYFFRGAITYGEAMWMSAYERRNAKEFLDKHLEQELKKPHPNY